MSYTNFFQIPNLIDDADLTPLGFRLYCHIKRIVGDTDKRMCNQGLRMLSQCTNMSINSVRRAKTELQNKGLINIFSINTLNGAGHGIRVVNIWKLNGDIYKKSIQNSTDYKLDSLFLTAKEAQLRSKRNRRNETKVYLPDEFEITDEMYTWAYENVPDLDIESEHESFIEIMRDHCITSNNWEDVWKGFMRKRDNKQKGVI